MAPYDDPPETDPPNTYFVQVALMFHVHGYEYNGGWREVVTDDPLSLCLDFARTLIGTPVVSWSVQVAQTAGGRPEVQAGSCGRNEMMITVFENPF